MLKFPGKRPTNLGAKDGKLLPCPGTPNCVCSQETRPEFKIEPITGATLAQVKAVVEGMERTAIIEATDTYLYAEFTTKLMGFVDDVEFYVEGDIIQVRSASRLGKSDLGLNRQRIEEIRTKLTA